jgi:hypothetical protein
MGILLRFPRHARPSVARSGALKPKTDGSAAFSKPARASVNVKKCSGGMAPRERQLLTADSPTPATEAAAVVPPKASITASTDRSMPPYTSQSVTMSSGHGSAIDGELGLGLKIPMPKDPKIIGPRLEQTREALGLSAAQLCRRIDCAQNRWSQYESGERPITLDIAERLCNEFGLTLDWIYRGDRSGLPQRLIEKLPPAEAPAKRRA